MKLSDYIVNFFYNNGIDTVMSITGGFAMHLNNSFGNHGKYNIYYNHHEQACGYSAIGYSKITNKPSIVCITSGIASLNAGTTCLTAYQDSVPILYISGQVSSELIKNKNLELRSYGFADSNIIEIVKPITKYQCEIYEIENLQNILNNIIINLTSGRLGPVWLSIPLDIQGKTINEELLNSYYNNKIIKTINNNIYNFNLIYEYLLNSKRPLIIGGNGIKLSNCINKFKNFINKYKIPVVVSMLGTDIIETDNILYSGRIGIYGNRHGNFTLQNCDLILSLGCRMSQAIIGYNNNWFARDAKIIYLDIDENELNKNNIKYDLKLKINLNDFFDYYDFNIIDYSEWINKCNHWKTKWINEQPLYKENIINPYNILYELFKILPENKNIISSTGSIITNLWHIIKIKTNDNFIISSQGDMGFEIPASIGAYIGNNNLTIVILGEGSFQLNIQELQTIVHHNFPIKILLFNNNTYGAIQITQNNFFKNNFGIDKDSGISFPNTEKICYAYNIKYLCINNNNNENYNKIFNDFLNYNKPILCEIFCCVQCRYPKLSAIQNNDGTFKNKPFEDMEPFLDRNEFYNEMITKPLD